MQGRFLQTAEQRALSSSLTHNACTKSGMHGLTRESENSWLSHVWRDWCTEAPMVFSRFQLCRALLYALLALMVMALSWCEEYPTHPGFPFHTGYNINEYQE